MQVRKHSISLKNIIILGFIVSLVSSVIIAGFVVYTNWLSSTEEIIFNTSEDISESIYDKVHNLIAIPKRSNEINHSVITNEILDLNDSELRDKFFVQALKAQDEGVYSFSFGTVNGEYYGARRSEQGTVEIMKNNDSTGRNSWYYQVREDLTAGELVYRAGEFDPRTRDWYHVAVNQQGPSFSSVYKHFVMDDLTISASLPIYDGEENLKGVLGTHMLIANIDSFLDEAMGKYNGKAVIIEEETGLMIANSMALDNFGRSPEGTFERYHIEEIGISDFAALYSKRYNNLDSKFTYEGEEGKLFVNTRRIQFEGLDWLIISTLSDSIYMNRIQATMGRTALLVALLLSLSLILFRLTSKKMMKPMYQLLDAAGALASGDLDQRLEILRDDEIGKLSESFNDVATEMSYLVGNLEAAVEERTKDLNHAGITIQENKEKLQLILDSAKEAIVGIDEKGKITFLNTSCLQILGYEDSKELVGADMHSKIHYLHKDGTYFDFQDCRIIKSVQLGEGISVDDEVFWRKDGSCFEVEYHAYPQIKEGMVIGAVVTFSDITERKIKEREIDFLTYHDNLTGLYNRTGFEKEKKTAEQGDRLPLGVIFGDLDGLKMTNDIFGHVAGDSLIKKAGKILKESCRDSDIIARVGGDEFIILLPKTEEGEGEKVLARIRERFKDAKIDVIKCTMALGFALKNEESQSLEEVITVAENRMYKDKTENHSATNRDILDHIIATLHQKNPEEKRHALNTKIISGAIGKALGLDKAEIGKLEKAAYLHDIGKTAVKDKNFAAVDSMNEEGDNVKQHSTLGFRMLSMFEDTMDLAEYIYNHHEYWNGKGNPRGIKGEQIPLFSRIIGLSEVVERISFKGDRSMEERKGYAAAFVKEESGRRFDPKVVKAYLDISDTLELKDRP